MKTRRYIFNETRFYRFTCNGYIEPACSSSRPRTPTLSFPPYPRVCSRKPAAATSFPVLTTRVEVARRYASSRPYDLNFRLIAPDCAAFRTTFSIYVPLTSQPCPEQKTPSERCCLLVMLGAWLLLLLCVLVFITYCCCECGGWCLLLLLLLLLLCACLLYTSDAADE